MIGAATSLLALGLLASGCARAYLDGDAGPDDQTDGFPSRPDSGDDPDKIVIQSATVGAPNTNGLNVTDNTWIGWRFQVEVETASDVVGFYTAGGSGTAFTTLIALDGETDLPDTADLSGTDVLLAPVVFNVRAAEGDIRIPLEVTLQPGWYAVVYGTDAFGATSADAMTLISRGNDMLEGAQFPFIMVQSTQAITETSLDGMRMFVEGRRP